jgi:hypothetical protein
MLKKLLSMNSASKALPTGRTNLSNIMLWSGDSKKTYGHCGQGDA